MTLSLETRGERRVAIFTSALDIYTASEVVTGLRALGLDQPLDVDTQGVESFDVAGVQVLAWLKARHPRVRFGPTASIVTETLEFLRLEGLMR